MHVLNPGYAVYAVEVLFEDEKPHGRHRCFHVIANSPLAAENLVVEIYRFQGVVLSFVGATQVANPDMAMVGPLSSLPGAVESVSLGMASQRDVFIVALAVGSCTDHEDTTVEGVYKISVSPLLSDADAASFALDGFHSQVAVGCLDDFEFMVLDGGRRLDQNPEHVSYSAKGVGEVIKVGPMSEQLRGYIEAMGGI